MQNLLFEVTKDQLETGLRGCPVGYCTTSFVNAHKGLFYRGRSICDIYQWPPERVQYLLLNGREGSVSDITDYQTSLQKRAQCSQAVIRHIEALPRTGDPMKLLSSAILTLGMIEGTGNYKEDCINVIAKLPHLVAIVINYHAGWGTTPSPQLGVGYMENFVNMLNVKGDVEHLLKVFRLFNILHYDHGGGNLACFVGKSIASSLEDIYGALCGSMCALSGERHGRANRDSLLYLQTLLNDCGEGVSIESLKNVLVDRIEEGELIYGFGHAVLRVEDPRATIFYEYATKYFSDTPVVKMALLMREAGTSVLSKYEKVSNPYPNVDAISGAVLSAAGFDCAEYYTLIFGLSRAVGIMMQILYERLEARDGQGTPIVRPTYLYKGPLKQLI